MGIPMDLAKYVYIRLMCITLSGSAFFTKGGSCGISGTMDTRAGRRLAEL